VVKALEEVRRAETRQDVQARIELDKTHWL
jgi:hypothetical protein